MKKNRTLSPLGRKAEKAMKDAVKKVIAEHTIKKLPLVIWENGNVVKVQPDKISVVRENKIGYEKTGKSQTIRTPN